MPKYPSSSSRVKMSLYFLKTSGSDNAVTIRHVPGKKGYSTAPSPYFAKKHDSPYYRRSHRGCEFLRPWQTETDQDAQFNGYLKFSTRHENLSLLPLFVWRGPCKDDTQKNSCIGTWKLNSVKVQQKQLFAWTDNDGK